jgi:hypothetical protein
MGSPIKGIDKWQRIQLPVIMSIIFIGQNRTIKPPTEGFIMQNYPIFLFRRQ